MTNEAPKASDALEVKEADLIFTPGPIGRLIENFFAAANMPDDSEAYQRALNDLKQQGESVVAEIRKAFGLLGEHQHSTKWLLLYTAREMRHPAALPFLAEVVRAPMASEPPTKLQETSPAERETILRTTAAEGVGFLAADGVDGALEALLSFLEVPSISVRRASVQSILASGRAEPILNQIKQLLPPEQQFLLELTHPQVGEVAQIADPRQHLRPDATPDAYKAPPDPLSAPGKPAPPSTE